MGKLPPLISGHTARGWEITLSICTHRTLPVLPMQKKHPRFYGQNVHSSRVVQLQAWNKIFWEPRKISEWLTLCCSIIRFFKTRANAVGRTSLLSISEHLSIWLPQKSKPFLHLNSIWKGFIETPNSYSEFLFAPSDFWRVGILVVKR